LNGFVYCKKYLKINIRGDKMFVFNRILTCCIVTTVLFLSVSAIAQNDKARVIHLGYGLAEQTNQGRAVKVFADMVEKISNGKMKVQAIGAAALGSDVKMQQALIDGTQEMMVGSTATLVSISKEMALWDTPFLFSNFKEADALLDGSIGTRVMENLPEKGLVGLAYWENGFRNLTNSKRAINRMEDLDGINLRVMQNTVFLDSFKTLGANAVPMSFSELFVALQNKKVDGQENPFSTILSSKFYDVQKYLTLTNHVYSPWIMLVSKKWWDKLSAEEQKILKLAAIASRDFERQDTRSDATKALDALKSKGMKVNELGIGEAYRMRNKLSKVYSKIGADIGIALWIDAQNELFNIRSKN
jgi:TRAP-type transport system periplasmic protein